jgi:hypothetical protein
MDRPDVSVEEWQRIGLALARPFQPDQIKQREGSKGMMFSYVDARDVAERLDEVVGWWRWSDDCEVVDEDTCAVRCRLTVCGVTKAGIGYPNSATDAENPAREPLKAAESDALKRAAVHFGVGRHLYRDGKPTGDSAGATGHVRATGSQTGRGPSPKQVTFITGLLEHHGFPVNLDGVDGATVSRWIDALKGDGPNAELVNPKTGEQLQSGHSGDGSMEDINADLASADRHIAEIARPERTYSPASANQLASIEKLRKLLGKSLDIGDISSEEATTQLAELSQEYNTTRSRQPAGRSA